MSNNSIFSSARWTIATSVIRKVFTFGLFYFVARILTKDDLGLFREYSLILTLASIFFVFSFDHFLIVTKEKPSAFFRDVLRISLFGGVIGSLLLFFSAELLGRIYHSFALVTLIKFTSSLLILENIRRMLSALMQRELRLKELAAYQTFNVIFYTIVTLIALFLKPSVWVLVLGFYSGNILELLLMTFNCKDLLKKYLRKQPEATGILRLIAGNNRFLSFAWINNILSNIAANAPILVLGMVFPLAGLGAYYLANQVIIIPVTIVTTALLQVFFPSFARKENHEIVEHIKQFTDFVLIGVFPLLALYALFSYRYIPLIFGEKWLEASQLALVLSFTSAVSLLMNPLSGIPYTLHKPDQELYWTIFSSILKVGAVLYFAKFGFLPAIIGFTGASIISQLVFMIMIGKMLNMKLSSYWKGFGFKILPTILLAISFKVVFSLEPQYSPFAGILLTAAYYLLIGKFTKYDLSGTAKQILKIKAGTRRQNS
ncbi:MAG: oligosaccharide flippase family protein [Candidatus Cloacimonetes bacterium]|nr:oligosaccharide flippase family protein [Candidatus Cloacimonadota bacterium]